MSICLISGDCRDVLPTLPDASVHCVVTSPPYYALRSYLDALHPDKHLELGSEPTPEAYITAMVGVFREVRRVLRGDGTCWVNIGDSFSGGNKVGWRPGNPEKNGGNSNRDGVGAVPGLAAKQLLLMPARLALGLQADGWFIRSDIIWHKPNPMPESCGDRPASSYEHVFLLTRSKTYFYDGDAVREEDGNHHRPNQDGFRHDLALVPGSGPQTKRCGTPSSGRNLRNVWTLATHPYPDAHFATYPPALAERCIKAGCPQGGTVLDPFAGAGTTLLVADRLQRDAVGIELNVAYTEMAMERCRADAPLFTSFPPAEDPEEGRMRDLFADDEYQQLTVATPDARLDAFRNSGRYVNQGPQPSNGPAEAAE